MGDGTNTSVEDSDRRAQGRFGWINGSLVTLALGSTALVFVGMLVQVSFGAYTMSITEAWQAVFNRKVLFNLEVWEGFLLGGGLPADLNLGDRAIIVPHVVRNIVGSDYKRVMVCCLFAGPALLVVPDVGARLALSTQIPVGVVTGLLGGPYFLYLMRKQQEIDD